ncbi:aminopeptidase N-like [Asterias amurensis]|uniref:aminopeptidase N-like n=1 Tax=Asterias amurensis TaxID=7602 RepID=UPI003AB4C0AB
MPPQKDRFVNFIVGPSKGGENHHDQDGEIHMAGVRMYTAKSTPCNRLAVAIAVIAVCLVLILTACLLVTLFARQSTQCSNLTSELDGNSAGDKDVANRGTQEPEFGPITTPASNGSVGNPHPRSFRLPITLKPLHYELELRPDISSNSFAGAVVIRFQCYSPTRFILLHSTELDIADSIELTEVGQGDGRGAGEAPGLLTGEPEFFTPYAFMKLQLDGPLKKGHIYSLKIRYHAKFSDKLMGLYVSKYEANHGKTKYVVASFLSPNGARLVFPCFDEPSFKANYTITIVHEQGYTALSNMPEEKRVPTKDGLVATHFMTTPKMSTYLVAFIVCDFWQESRTVDNTRFSVWAREEVFNDTLFALEYGTRAFTFLEDYSGLEYPLPKIDLIALPQSIAAGMENWGLLTFKESHMLLDPNEASSDTSQEIATIIGHEIAHQWYSNLVTQEYWGELWMKECFANLLAYLALDHIHPERNMMDELSLATEEFLRVMLLDALPTSHAIQGTINDISDILNNFDLTSYYKSEAVVRMLRYLVGSDVFQSGMTKFLQTHAYSNAKATDLWDALSEALRTDRGTRINITDFMDPWMLQMGYPVVTMTRDYQTRIVEMSQEPFLLHPDAINRLPSSPYGYQWRIPILYSYADQLAQPPIHVLRGTSGSLSVQEMGTDQWILANMKRTGFYRTNYDEANWDLLIKQLREDHTVISASNRAMLIDDAFHLATAGRLSITVALNLTTYLHKEREYVPWKVTLQLMGYVARMLSFTSSYGNLKKYIEQQLLPVYRDIGWNHTDSHGARLLQGEVLKALCSYGNEDCISKANSLFKNHVEHGKRIPPDLKPCVYQVGVANGNSSTREYAWEQYRSGTTGENLLWLASLAGTTEPWLLCRFMERSLDPSLVPVVDTVEVFKHVVNNPIGGYLAWNFFRQHWDIFVERYSGGIFLMNGLIDTVTKWFSTDFHLKELREFIAGNELSLIGKAGMKNFRQAEETTAVNVHWMETNYEDIKQWLEEAVSGD